MKQMTGGSLALRQNQYGVIEIAAAKQQDAAKLRVAAYARVSSDSTDQLNSFMAQTNYYTTLIASEDHWTMADLYADDGYTGRNFNRPSFQRMIADIEAGKVGCVITKDLSRLGRNYIEAGSYIEIFFPKHNVVLSIH